MFFFKMDPRFPTRDQTALTVARVLVKEFSNLECVNEFILTKGNVLKLRLSNNYVPYTA